MQTAAAERRAEDLCARIDAAQDLDTAMRLADALIAGLSTIRGTGDLEADDRKPLFVPATDLLSQPAERKTSLGPAIEQDTFGQLFGPSGSGKSFVAIDMCCCKATGTPWNGNPCEPGLVIYFAGEGHTGLKRRIRAWALKNESPDLSNFLVSRLTISFDPPGIRKVIGEVREIEASTSKQVALIIIDTLARHLQGDENSTRDMSEFVRLVDGLRAAFPGSTSIIVHHTGNNAENANRSRGSSALKAACDFEIHCDRGLLTFTKVKDCEPPEPIEFKLVPVEVGTDVNGEPITSCVVSYGERSAKNKEVSLNAGERELLELVKANPDILSGDLRAVLFEQRKSKDPDAKYDTLKKAFTRSLNGLIEKGKVFMDGYVVKEGRGQNRDISGTCPEGVGGQTGTTPLKGCPVSPPLSPSPSPPQEEEFFNLETEVMSL